MIGQRRIFLAWSAAVTALLVLFAWQVAPHLKFETNVLALLPPDAADPDATRAFDQVADQIGRRAVFLVGAGDFATARRAAQDFAGALRASPAFAEVSLGVDADWPQRAAEAYQPFRDGLLSDRSRAWLRSGDDAALLAQARQTLYTPAAFMRRTSAASDPLDLFGDFLRSAMPAAGRATLHDGVLVAVDPPPGTRQWVMVRTTLAGNAFSTAEEDAAGPALDAAFAAARAAGGEAIGSGPIQHAVAASRLARHEVKLFGGVQLLCVAAVLLLVFRSVRVLLLSTTALAIGLLAALTACHYLFGRVHVLTLVFCSNLAGIAIDYSVYYCADQFRQPGRWRASDALAFIGPAIGMSCLVSLMSYALLAVAPFPGLRQMSLFCCVGLAAAYACVMAWFPRAVRAAPAAAAQHLARAFGRATALRERIRGRDLRWLGVLCALLVVVGLARLKVQDDVRALQPDTPLLIDQERAVRERLGEMMDSRFFLVRASGPQQLLEGEEALRERLDPMLARGELGSYSAVSRALPSLRRQAQNRELLASRVYGESGLAARFMRELGFPQEVIAQQATDFPRETPTLTPEAWLGTPAADPYRSFWLGDLGGGAWASLVILTGVRDVNALRAAATGLPQAHLVDRVGEVTQVLRRYRTIALWIVAASVLASALLLALPYGWRRGLLLMRAPVVAALATPAALGLLGVPLTFFHVVALHLVLGLSMEYAILLQLPELRGPSTLLSVSLAAGLALLAFGLLGLSATPFIHSIGLTVALGVSLGAAGAALLRDIPEENQA